MSASPYEFTPDQNILVGHLASLFIGLAALLAITLLSVLTRVQPIPTAW